MPKKDVPAPALDGKQGAVLIALAFTSVWLAILRALFIWQSPRIIAATPSTNPALVTLWVRWAVYEHDGIETFVIFFGTAFFLASVAAATWWLSRRTWGKGQRFVWVLGVLATWWTVWSTRSSEFLFAASAGMRWAVLFIAPAAIAAWYFAHKRSTETPRRITFVLAAVLVAIVCLASAPEPAVIDYGFYIGPALKHMQGAALGSFYMQYNLLGTLIIEALMYLDMRLHSMEMVQNVLLAGFYVLYWLLARRLFKNRFMALLCMAALVIVRLLNVRGHPAALPQVMPTRLDMWVPLLLAVDHWGLRSWKTALAFAAVYAGDATFGFLHSAVYVVTLGFTRDVRATRFVAPIVAVGLFQKLVFGSFVSPAAAHYIDLQLGFMPIAPASLFWPVALALGVATAIFAHHRHEHPAPLGLMMCMMAVVQLTYFFGRSDDHNLINVSAAWIFPLFLALERVPGRVGIATAVLTAFTLMGAQESWRKLERVRDRVFTTQWVVEWTQERELEVYRQFGGPNMMLFETGDAYMNYRLGLKQRGYFSPLEANYLVEDTAKYLRDELLAGARLIGRSPTLLMYVHDLNRASALRDRKLVISRAGYFYEVKLAD